ncbi:hypothetical protein ACQ3I4_13610 [Zafaria sp. Z1313]|uniref:hypothetical protein n=1 Tax=unclassified Zafaria TaxID=2828765 RepID=UPI002E761A9C|nr:hypothetical protein [Zafaria sp. J156]MEE1620906.1 hypothetical protein [Zafaria sp. J156]
MGMFDKLVRKGREMAADYLREQSGQSRNAPRQGGHGTPGYGQYDAGRPAPVPGGGYAAPRHGDGLYAAGAPGTSAGAGSGAGAEDRAAIERYRYMLRTAPPQDMERAHQEAFERLTPQQRELLRQELAAELPAAEQPRTDAPFDLARSATRAEVSRPGFMERLLGGQGGAGFGASPTGPSVQAGSAPANGARAGGMAGGLAAGAAGGLGAGLLAGVAGAFIGTAVAGPLLEGFSGIGDGLAGAVDGFGDGIGEQIGGLGEGISGLGDGLGGAADGLGEQVSAAGDQIGGLGEQAGGLFDGLLNGGGLFGDTGSDWEF